MDVPRFCVYPGFRGGGGSGRGLLRTYYDSLWGGVAGEVVDFFEGVVFWFGGRVGCAVGSSVGSALAVGLGEWVGAEEVAGDGGGGFEGGGGGRVVSALGLQAWCILGGTTERGRKAGCE